MKKTISFILCLAMIFAFAGCASETDNNASTPTDENVVNDESANSVVFNDATGESPAVYAVVSNDSPVIGEEIIIDVHLKNAPMFCSIDLTLDYNANALSVRHAGTCKIPNIVDNINIENGKVVYSGLVMRSEDVADSTLFKIAITPKEGASGVQTIAVNGLSLLLALDPDGNATIDKTAELVTTDITLTVQ